MYFPPIWPRMVSLDGCSHPSARIEQRLQTPLMGAFVPHSGSAVSFMNGAYQVSYDEIEAIEHSRKGDPVLMCLVSVPQRCPPGDTRGRMYTTTNLRLGSSWTLSDSEHSPRPPVRWPPRHYTARLHSGCGRISTICENASKGDNGGGDLGYRRLL